MNHRTVPGRRQRTTTVEARSWKAKVEEVGNIQMRPHLRGVPGRNAVIIPIKLLHFETQYCPLSAAGACILPLVEHW